VGTQLVDDLAAHEARSATRRVMTSLFDAWDAGDVVGFVSHFDTDAMWADPSGARSLGRDDLAAQFAQWRRWEPFSVHWLANEQVLVEDGRHATGTWLWSAASDVDGGELAAWSGGDLAVRFAATPDGWRIASLVMSDRYRAPYLTGWLHQLLVAPRLGDREPWTPDPAGCGTPVEGLPAAAPPAATDTAVGEDVRRARLFAESEVRWAVGEYADAVELGRDRDELAAFFTEDAEFTSELTPAAVGRDRVLDAHLAEAAQVSAWIRAQMSVHIAVGADATAATCRWRDLWTAEVDGRPRWLAHTVEAELVAGGAGAGWQLRRLVRRPLLDCSYEEGWSPAVAERPAEESPPVVKEMHR
jgi:ketosteroid isomerase-like protein